MKFKKTLFGTIFVGTSMFFSASTFAAETSVESFVTDSLKQYMAEVDAELDMRIANDLASINNQLSVIENAYVVSSSVISEQGAAGESEQTSEVKVEKAE